MLIQSVRRIISPESRCLYRDQRRFLKRPSLNTSQLPLGRRSGALAMKVGMMTLFDKWGQPYPTTVLHLDECEVIRKKELETDGYVAVQLGVGEAKLQRVNITTLGQYNLSECKPKRKLAEFRVTEDCLLEPGTKVSALHFVPGQLVDVCGISKGKGFQGPMKRWGFKGGPASHGASLSHRIHGSTGQCQDPGKVFKNKKMAGRMGSDRTTVQNLKIIKIDPQRDLIWVKGAVPGNAGGFVRIVDAVKGPFYPSPPPMPTYVQAEDTNDEDLEPVWAPLGDVDPGIQTVSEDQFI